MREVTSVTPWRLTDELPHKKMPAEVCSSWTVYRTKLSGLVILLHCAAIAGYNTLVTVT